MSDLDARIDKLEHQQANAACGCFDGGCRTCQRAEQLCRLYAERDTEAATVAAIVKWLRSQRRCFCMLEGFAVGRHDNANCPKPIDEYEDAADDIERGEFRKVKP